MVSSYLGTSWVILPPDLDWAAVAALLSQREDVPGEGLVMLLAARLSREYSREEENVVYTIAPAFTRLLKKFFGQNTLNFYFWSKKLLIPSWLPKYKTVY